MKQFSTTLHTVIHLKRQALQCIICVLFTVIISQSISAQCINTNSSGNIAAPAPGNTAQINACAFAGDYSTITGVSASTSYTVTSSVSTPVNDYFTVRQGTPSGPVIAFGASPLTWTSVGADTYYVHVNSYYICGIQATCRTTSITNNGVCTPPTVTVTPAVSCSGTCTPITASGADSYIWYPYTGLFHDCAATVPYQGGNATSLYTRFVNNSGTTYTVTGKINATGCTGTATAVVNYTPNAPRILPNPAYVCAGGTPVKLRTTSSGNLSYCSGPVNLAVPDNNTSGVFSTIAVSGAPADCNPIAISAEINMAHTRIGDMVFALKAPNGQIINLDYFISGTYGNGASTGFTNTNISSSILNPLSSGSSPYTGTFSADLRNTIAAGPTGMQPNSTNWGSLFSQVNGNWVLGMYDGVSFQTGTLNAWCLKFNFPCATTGDPNATPAVWSPIAGLYTDANGTQPYTGTPIDSVWVKPGIAGTFTYQATTRNLPPASQVCTSLPGSVTVIAGAPAAITSQPADQSFCNPGGVAVFSVGVTGSGIGFQWQLSGDGGINWFNVPNSGSYSGMNTATLTVNPVTAIMNGYRFRVSISGCNGNMISNTALLRINPIPFVNITANPVVIGPTQTSTISSTVFPNPATSYAWYYNSALIPGATNPSLLVNYGSPGDYQLKVTDANNCGVGVSNIVTIANSFASFKYVYPNPAGGIFQVRHPLEPNSPAQRTINVFNNQGILLLSKTVTQSYPYQAFDVDISQYGPGMYWVEWRVAGGGRLAMSKVVVN